MTEVPARPATLHRVPQTEMDNESDAPARSRAERATTFAKRALGIDGRSPARR